MAAQMTEQEIMQGKLLSPETSQLLSDELWRLEAELCNVSFPADPVKREEAILFYVETQAKRNVLAALLDTSRETYKYLADTTGNIPSSVRS